MTTNKARKASVRAEAAAAGISYTAALRLHDPAAPPPAKNVPEGLAHGDDLDALFHAADLAALERLGAARTRGSVKLTVDAQAVGLAAEQMVDGVDARDQVAAAQVLRDIIGRASRALDGAYARSSDLDHFFGTVPPATIDLAEAQASALLDAMALEAHHALPLEAALDDGWGLRNDGQVDWLSVSLTATRSLVFGSLPWPKLPWRLLDRDAAALPFHAAVAAAGAPRGPGLGSLGDPTDPEWSSERDALARMGHAGVDPAEFAALLVEGWSFPRAVTLLTALRPSAGVMTATRAAAVKAAKNAGEARLPKATEGDPAADVTFLALVAAAVGAGDVTLAPAIASQSHLTEPLFIADERPDRFANQQLPAEVLRQRAEKLLAR